MDEKTMFALMVDLHRGGLRQGPGSDEDTLRALDLTEFDKTAEPRVIDIGCGTGASTLVLAKALPKATFVAVDLFPEFLDVLTERASSAGCAERIETRVASMESLDLAPESFDLVWSEGAIYNMGFRAGLRSWRRLLRPGGVIAVTEITWLRDDPPEEIADYWEDEYPEIATADEKRAILQEVGYQVLGDFVLPETSWTKNYYDPTAARIPGFLERHAGRRDAQQIVEMDRMEAELYRRHKNAFGYVFYVARKR